MQVYRIALSKYSDSLIASGRAARWNFNEVQIIYSACSLSLACLENVVHRSKLGLSANFSVMYLTIPDEIEFEEVKVQDLPENWTGFENMHHTQKIGSNWIIKNKTAVLRIPSSIIQEEHNYLINPMHPDFQKIKLLTVKPFLFDEWIKKDVI